MGTRRHAPSRRMPKSCDNSDALYQQACGQQLAARVTVDPKDGIWRRVMLQAVSMNGTSHSDWNADGQTRRELPPTQQ
jgi:hypothetical protein